ncbi:MAG: DegT/DnrJ/EryC1/StrS family aminotransferase [Planctomycetota bacterium]
MAKRNAESQRLAIDGGPKTRTKPFPVRRLYGKAEKQALTRLVDRAMTDGSRVMGYNGPQEEAYCREFAEFLGGGVADGVNSGTSAVYVALQALELPPGSEVIVPPITDPGSVMPVTVSGRVPVPADTAPGTYNVGAEQIAARITKRTSAVIVAHISGLPCDMDAIMKVARRHKLRVIEDCAQSHGATWKGRPIGTFGDIAAYSTMFSKHHGTGGQGGIVFTRDEDLYWRVRRWADRGKPFGLGDRPADDNVVASLNFNMDELHACIGRVQLRKLRTSIRRDRAVASVIADGCREKLRTVRLLEPPPGGEGVYWFLFLGLDLDKLNVDKSAFVDALRAEGIPASHSYCRYPVRMHWNAPTPAAATRYRKRHPLPNAEAVDASHFRLMIHEGWTKRDAADVVRALVKVERAYL